MSRRDDVTREQRKLRNEELNNPYYSPNILRVKKSRRMRLVGHVQRMGEGRSVYRFLVVRPRPRWEDNIKMYLQELGHGGMDLIKLAQDRDRWRGLVNVVMNLNIGRLVCS